MTPNPVIGGNNYNDSSNISSRNYTGSVNYGRKHEITKLKSNGLVISKVKKVKRTKKERNLHLNSSFIKNKQQK